MGTIAEKLARLRESKEDIRRAITARGGTVPENEPFSGYADCIESIPVGTGTDTSDADAAAGDILAGKTAYVNGKKITGTIPSQAAKSYTPYRSSQTIAAGQFLSGAQTVKGDANLLPENIKKGVSIFGVGGTSEDETNYPLVFIAYYTINNLSGGITNYVTIGAGAVLMLETTDGLFCADNLDKLSTTQVRMLYIDESSRFVAVRMEKVLKPPTETETGIGKIAFDTNFTTFTGYFVGNRNRY